MKHVKNILYIELNLSDGKSKLSDI